MPALDSGRLVFLCQIDNHDDGEKMAKKFALASSGRFEPEPVMFPAYEMCQLFSSTGESRSDRASAEVTKATS